MKPILYKSDEIDFNHRGIGVLVDTVEAIVTEERNGMFELEFVYPLNGLHFDSIQEDCIVKAKPNDTMNEQLFRIYKSTKPINGLVTFYAQHISYDLRYNPLPKISVSGQGQIALNTILTSAINEHPFTGYSDVMTDSSTEIGPVNVRQALGGTEGSLLDNWGGEFEFDNFVIRHLQQRGQDTGILISYGKNLTDFEQEKELDAVFTSVYPYAVKDEQVITLPEKIISLESESTYPIKRTMMLDLSNDESVVDADTLRTAATNYANENEIDKPKVSWKISFVNLWQTEEYKDLAILERVNLCDYVTVRFEKYDVDVKAKVIRTVYDVLKEKYREIELGDARSDFVNDFKKSQQETKKQIEQTTSFLQEAIDRATDAITGTSGGYIRLNPKENPQELLIMDTPDINTATKVWRWNLGGLGYSKNGYNGPYELAMTMNGEIVANFITTGILKAIGIEGVTISGSSFTISNGGFELKINKDVGITIKKDGDIKFSVDTNGNVKIYGAEYSGGSFVTDGEFGRVEVGFSESAIKVYYFDTNDSVIITPTRITFEDRNGRVAHFSADSLSLYPSQNSTSEAYILLSDTGATLYLDGDAYANNWYTNSLESLKQDIQQLPDGFATDLIKNMDILSFKYKGEMEKGIEKAKFGPVIGEKYNTPSEIMDPNKKSTDDHSALYIAIQALKEQMKRIDALEKEIALLKEGNTNAE